MRDDRDLQRMAICLLIFPNLAQMRRFFQRPEWVGLAPLLYPLGPHHWRLPTGGEVYVVTAASEQTPLILRRPERALVYLFVDPNETAHPRMVYLQRMLETLQTAKLIDVYEVSIETQIDWEQLGILSSPDEG